MMNCEKIVRGKSRFLWGHFGKADVGGVFEGCQVLQQGPLHMSHPW